MALRFTRFHATLRRWGVCWARMTPGNRKVGVSVALAGHGFCLTWAKEA